MTFELNIIFLLTLKHFIADWVLQTDAIAKNKGNSLKFLAIHCLHHSVLTFLILIIFFNLNIAVSIVMAEFFVHGLIDWLKANPKVSSKFRFPSHKFWILIGFDQYLHQLTYIGITYYLVSVYK